MAALKLADREDGAHTRNLSNFSTGSVVEHELDDPEAGHISEDALASVTHDLYAEQAKIARSRSRTERQQAAAAAAAAAAQRQPTFSLAPDRPSRAQQRPGSALGVRKGQVDDDDDDDDGDGIPRRATNEEPAYSEDPADSWGEPPTPKLAGRIHSSAAMLPPQQSAGRAASAQAWNPVQSTARSVDRVGGSRAADADHSQDDLDADERWQANAYPQAHAHAQARAPQAGRYTPDTASTLPKSASHNERQSSGPNVAPTLARSPSQGGSRASTAAADAAADPRPAQSGSMPRSASRSGRQGEGQPVAPGTSSYAMSQSGRQPHAAVKQGAASSQQQQAQAAKPEARAQDTQPQAAAAAPTKAKTGFMSSVSDFFHGKMHKPTEDAAPQKRQAAGTGTGDTMTGFSPTDNPMFGEDSYEDNFDDDDDPRQHQARPTASANQRGRLAQRGTSDDGDDDGHYAQETGHAPSAAAANVKAGAAPQQAGVGRSTSSKDTAQRPNPPRGAQEQHDSAYQSAGLGGSRLGLPPALGQARATAASVLDERGQGKDSARLGRVESSKADSSRPSQPKAAAPPAGARSLRDADVEYPEAAAGGRGGRSGERTNALNGHASTAGRPPLNGGSAQAPSSATGASIGPFGTSQPAQQEQQVQADGRSQQKGAQPPDRMTSARRVSFNSQLARSASEVTDDEQSGGQYSDHEHDESRDMHALGHSGMPGERDVRKEHRGLDFPSSSDSNQRSTQLALVVPQHGGSSSFGLDREFDSPSLAAPAPRAAAAKPHHRPALPSFGLDRELNSPSVSGKASAADPRAAAQQSRAAQHGIPGHRAGIPSFGIDRELDSPSVTGNLAMQQGFKDEHNSQKPLPRHDEPDNPALHMPFRTTAPPARSHHARTPSRLGVGNQEWDAKVGDLLLAGQPPSPGMRSAAAGQQTGLADGRAAGYGAAAGSSAATAAGQRLGGRDPAAWQPQGGAAADRRAAGRPPLLHRISDDEPEAADPTPPRSQHRRSSRGLPEDETTPSRPGQHAEHTQQQLRQGVAQGQAPPEHHHPQSPDQRKQPIVGRAAAASPGAARIVRRTSSQQEYGLDSEQEESPHLAKAAKQRAHSSAQKGYGLDSEQESPHLANVPKQRAHASGQAEFGLDSEDDVASAPTIPNRRRPSGSERLGQADPDSGEIRGGAAWGPYPSDRMVSGRGTESRGGASSVMQPSRVPPSHVQPPAHAFRRSHSPDGCNDPEDGPEDHYASGHPDTRQHGLPAAAEHGASAVTKTLAARQPTNAMGSRALGAYELAAEAGADTMTKAARARQAPRASHGKGPIVYGLEAEADLRDTATREYRDVRDRAASSDRQMGHKRAQDVDDHPAAGRGGSAPRTAGSPAQRGGQSRPATAPKQQPAAEQKQQQYGLAADLDHASGPRQDLLGREQRAAQPKYGLDADVEAPDSRQGRQARDQRVAQDDYGLDADLGRASDRRRPDQRPAQGQHGLDSDLDQASSAQQGRQNTRQRAGQGEGSLHAGLDQTPDAHPDHYRRGQQAAHDQYGLEADLGAAHHSQEHRPPGLPQQAAQSVQGARSQPAGLRPQPERYGTQRSAAGAKGQSPPQAQGQSPTARGKAGGGLKARAPLTDAEIRATKLARAKRRLRAMLAINHHEYMENLGPLAPHAKPSTLQRLVKRAFNSTSTFCKVAPSLDGLSAEGLLLDGTGQLSPQPKVPQFSLTLVSVKGLASTGVAGRQAWLQVARMCLYDGRRFLGNVQAVKPRKLANNGSSWVFDPVPFLVRAGRVQKDLQVVIEFNISYELTSTEAANLSASHRRAAAQVDEITLGWAVVNAAELCKVQKELTVNIQLLGGSLTHCNLLSRYNSAVPPVTGMLSRLMSLGGTPSPTLVIKASPTRLNAAEAAAAAMLPPQAIVAPALQQVLAVYRGIMAQQLAQAGSYMASVADPVLVTFPRIVDDAELCSAFLRLWEQHISPRVSPSTVELELVFKQTVMMMWPLLHSQAVLQPTIANFMAHQGERGKKMAEFMALHPVTSMSHRSAEWLHKPFAASELVVHAYGGLGHTV